MSFLGGAECSTAGNPLSQFTKHVQDDRSLQRDRLVNNAPNGSLNGFRSAGRGATQDEMVNGFLQQGPPLPELAMDPGPMTMALANQMALNDPARTAHLRAQSASPVWSEPGFRASPVPMDAAFRPEEFAKFQQQSQQPLASSSSPSAAAATMTSAAGPAHAQPMMGMGMGMGSMGMGMGPSAMAGMGMGMGVGGYDSTRFMMFRQQQQMQQQMQQQSQFMYQQQADSSSSQMAEGKGKGKVVELNDHEWEEQFARMEMQDKTKEEARQEQEAAARMERELEQLDEQVNQSETGFGDLEAVWNGIRAENAAMREAFEGGATATTALESDSASEWKDVSENFTRGTEDDWEPLNYRMGLDPRVEAYAFEQENLFAGQQNPFAEGVRIMEENGNLSLAALAFEAAVQREPERVEAWVYLGTAQAQNEKETAAIRALEQALKLDPTNLAALMALAVSYTNEGYDTTAYRTLERWLSAKYPQVLAPTELSSAADIGFTDRQKLHERITERFIAAAQLSPDGEHMDPDVQVGLGVLFYGGEEYDKAVDCFQAALASSEQGTSNQRSQVHLLWNRLGATLANSGRSEEAIAAYERALALHPNFVRARYNLGVSCINMGCYDEAAGHLLAALAMHKNVEKSGREQAREILGGAAAGVTDEHLDRMTMANRSTTLHDTLRRVFGQMDRRDLADRVTADMDPDTFRAEFDF